MREPWLIGRAVVVVTGREVREVFNGTDNIMRDSLDGFNIMTDEQWADLIDVAIRLDISRPELFSTAIIEWVERHKGKA